jgi:hypothetical protein
MYEIERKALSEMFVMTRWSSPLTYQVLHDRRCHIGARAQMMKNAQVESETSEGVSTAV